MEHETALRHFLTHLREEKACLEEIACQLEREADAARRMDLDVLVEVAHSKEMAVDLALKLARERAAKLNACLPHQQNTTIQELIDTLTGDACATVSELRSELRTLSAEVLVSAQKAAARNESGLELLSGALKSGRRVKSRHSLTYSAKGKIHTGVQFLHGERRTR